MRAIEAYQAFVMDQGLTEFIHYDAFLIWWASNASSIVHDVMEELLNKSNKNFKYRQNWGDGTTSAHSVNGRGLMYVTESEAPEEYLTWSEWDNHNDQGGRRLRGHVRGVGRTSHRPRTPREKAEIIRRLREAYKNRNSYRYLAPIIGGGFSIAKLIAWAVLVGGTASLIKKMDEMRQTGDLTVITDEDLQSISFDTLFGGGGGGGSGPRML